MKKSVYICLMLSALCTMAYAVPAHPGGVTRTLPDGTQETIYLHGDEFYHWTDNTPEAVLPDVNGPARSPLRQAGGPNKVIGQPYLPERGLVILVNFKDLKFQKENTRNEMDSLMNGKNYTYNGAYKSVREYFYDQSNGHYHPKFDVIGPVELDSSYAYYGTNDRSGFDQYLGDMVLEACIKADLDFGVDFSQYAKQDSKKVDFVFLYFAGPGENYAGVSSDHCWPLQYNLTQCGNYINRDLHPNWTKEIVRDGVTVDMFAYTNEVSPQNVREGIGTFCHEFGHVLGLADYYNTNGVYPYYSCTPALWHTMAEGCYNNNGNIPPSYSPFEKFFFGWATPTLLNKGQTLYTLPADGQTFTYISKSGEPIVPTQYEDTVFYFENRQGQGWDQGVDGYKKGPGKCHGMLIWRVVYNKVIWQNNQPNNVNNHPRISIVPSTGSATVTNTNTDVYPGSKQVTTVPLFSDFTLYRIQEKDGVVSFQLNDNPMGLITPQLSTYRKVLEQGQVWIVDPKNNQKRYTILGHE